MLTRTSLLGLAAPVALTVLLAARGASVANPAPGRPLALAAAVDDSWPDSPGGQLVFFAVLEGLYTDGVQPEAVRAILTGPPESEPADGPPVHELAPRDAWQQALETMLFVPGCPLCTPALVAFETYAARGSLHLKGPRDTFGPGLPDDVVARLQSPDRKERLAALEGLVKTWITRRLDLGRATEVEREQFRIWMEDGRKFGMNQLAALRRNLDTTAAASWMRCASCDGSVEACTR